MVSQAGDWAQEGRLGIVDIKGKMHAHRTGAPHPRTGGNDSKTAPINKLRCLKLLIRLLINY